MSSIDHKVPKIVLIGPTNVGKSALFNRLTRTRAAIVCDRPGVTVDRHELRMKDSHVGPLLVIDTGGVGPEALAHDFGKEIERAASVAVEGADLILFVVDGTKDIGIEEFEVASWLRQQKGIDNSAVWVLANKSDSKKHDITPFYSLGFEQVLPVSAEHDLGILDFWEEVARFFKSKGILPEDLAAHVADLPPHVEPETRVVILGRPNVGKSTLSNQLLGEERHVVSDIAGTTRDPIESEFRYGGMLWNLVDTAGMRQPGRLERDVEWVAREKMKDLVRKADVAIVVVDGSEGISVLDASIAGLALDFGLSLVVAINKWDKMSGDDADDKWKHLERTSDLKFDFVRWCPWVKISAMTGKGIGELLKTVKSVIEARKQRVQTSKLNQLFEKRIRLHAHPLGPGGRVAKFYYMSQVKANPPEFVLFSNLPGSAVHFSFRRFLVNSLRDEFGFKGTPVKVHFKMAHKTDAQRTELSRGSR